MGVKWKWLAKMFAFFGAGVGLLGIGTFTQVNGISSAVCNFFDPDKVNTIALFGRDYSIATIIAGLALTVCVGLVVIGGLKRIASVSQVVVPFMAIIYFVFAFIVIITHITALPAKNCHNRKECIYRKRTGRWSGRNDGSCNAEGYCTWYLLK